MTAALSLLSGAAGAVGAAAAAPATTITADAPSSGPGPQVGSPGRPDSLDADRLHQNSTTFLPASSSFSSSLSPSPSPSPSLSLSLSPSPSPSFPYRLDNGRAADTTVLNFADLPSDLTRLSFDEKSTESTLAKKSAKSTSPESPKRPERTAQTTPIPSLSVAASTSATPLLPVAPGQKPSRSLPQSPNQPPTHPAGPSISPVVARLRSSSLSGSQRPASLSSPSSSSQSPSSATPSSLSITAPPVVVQARKPSPGLAARLRALGFGTSTEKASPPPSSSVPSERIGRLPEDQLRQLDEKHQAGSTVPVIERRGRPWKGAGSVVARIPASVASFKAGRSKNDPEQDSEQDLDLGPEYNAASDSGSVIGPATIVTAPANDDEAAAAQRADSTVVASPASSFLPEIETPPPLEMDTNKYRLPDHTNGNGTKVQLDTRQQHLERNLGTAYIRSVTVISPDNPPPPLPKDTPPLSSPASGSNPTFSPIAQSDFNPDAISYFNPLGLQRPGSIYTLSRVSFANQLAQLTSLQLPDAEMLSSKVSAIPTAQVAARALIGAAEQIRIWISKASEVIGGLDSDDDVEWAAAGGREGLEEVENAIVRFEELINVYVSAIEDLQSRPDIAAVPPEDLQRAVVQMESILDEWRNMRNALQSVKAQVEIAMEWEELWSMVLGDIQNEMDELSRLVFEMEERRHKSMMAESGAATDAAGNVDIGDLETIVEETKEQQQKTASTNNPTRLPAASGNNRYSIPIFPASPSSPDPASTGTPSVPSISQDDSSLLALFARMQPLRASLDFLPMRLSVFETRASSCFPTACEELEMRRIGLDGSYRKLEKDAESLRKELGEDRWVTVFRGAARQAQKMYESVERSVAKLKEGLDTDIHSASQPHVAKKIESYETKKMHYGPAIERVLSIIDKGIKDRLTLNGEILRLHAELQSQWDELRDRMHGVDVALEELHAEDKRSQQLRDSISSMLSNDRSTLNSAHDTPQTSPPSSVIMSSLGFGSAKKRNADNKGTPATNARRRSFMGSHLPQPAAANRRSLSSSAGSPASQMRKSASRFASTTGTSSPIRDGSVTPINKRVSMLPSTSSAHDNRPRWSYSTSGGIDTGHNFKPLTLTTPSPFSKTPPMRRSASSAGNTPGSNYGLGLTTKLPMRSPLGREASASPGPADSPSRGPLGTRDALPYRPRLTPQSSKTSPAANRRASMQPSRPPTASSNAHYMGAAARPASSMSMSRRNSMLSAPRPRREGSVSGDLSGRDSPQSVAGSQYGMRKNQESKLNDKPRWRV